MNDFNKNIEDLTFAFLSDGLTRRERDVLKDLLKVPENRACFKRMHAVWYAANRTAADESVDKALQKALFRINNSKSERRRPFSFGNVAAAVFIAFVAGALLHFAMSGRKLPTVETAASACKITVPQGSKSYVELPDGTTVTLNAGSRLLYGPEFGNTSRELQLEGEGYFKVAKNEKIPFIVRAKDVTVKALGTEFNVKAYPDEHLVQTTLVEGSVSIVKTGKTGTSKEYMLKPDQTLTFVDELPAKTRQAVRQTANRTPAPAENAGETGETGETDIILENKVKTELYTSWKDPRWVIESEPVEDLALKLQRRYNVRITIADEALKQYPFNGIIADETLEQVLDIMKSAAPIDYVIHKKNVILKINPHQRKIFEKSMK